MLDVLWDGVAMCPDEDWCSCVAKLVQISGDDEEVLMLSCTLYCHIGLWYVV